MSGAVALFAGPGLLVAFVAVIVGVRRRYLVVTVHGESMLPTYRPGERVLVRRARAGSLRTGQVVVLRELVPDGQAEPRPHWIVKRVTALPGDPVPRDTVPALRAAAGTRVPAGHLVVLGDNPDRSHDSRHSGYLTTDRLYGVVLRRLG
ncbi:S26 family signal peptidase [Nonomuraea roseoviolacea subsp. roseoviolacea]|uniref:S26 family signal peptidase n=1 Tax=Nonomuraea roseoviolacea TaxID=103837 RepID=UPI0031D6728B